MTVSEKTPQAVDDPIRSTAPPRPLRPKRKPKHSKREMVASSTPPKEMIFPKYPEIEIIEEEIDTGWHIIRLPINLPYEDGKPLESNWHRSQIGLFIDSTRQLRPDKNYYSGGNMFVYFSRRQWRGEDFRGPDFFFVDHVDGTYDRESWRLWDENGRYPDLIIELLSPATAEVDRGVKKQIYSETFGTKNYFHYDPATKELVGYHLVDGVYEQLQPNAEGRLWCTVLNVWVGLWEGEYLGHRHVWVRFFDEYGNLVPTGKEAAELEALAAQRQAEEAQRQVEDAQRQAEEAQRQAEDAQRQAQLERIRAQQAEDALLQLQAQLRSLGMNPDQLMSNDANAEPNQGEER